MVMSACLLDPQQASSLASRTKQVLFWFLGRSIAAIDVGEAELSSDLSSGTTADAEDAKNERITSTARRVSDPDRPVLLLAVRDWARRMLW